MEYNHDSIQQIDINLIRPNPYQPRINFEEASLRDLAESIKHYGILQPLTVVHKKDTDGDYFELIAGERRLRASKIVGLEKVPVIIKPDLYSSQEKLELAILENLQREDLNPVDRAIAFKKLVNEFKFRHIDIARKLGKSREFVSNSLRILNLPEEIAKSLSLGKITDGHAKSLLMLSDKPQEQMNIYREIVTNNLTVREANNLVRKIAINKVRKKDLSLESKTLDLERRLSEALGTRVSISKNYDSSGKLIITFFSEDDLNNIENKILNMELYQDSYLDSSEYDYEDYDLNMDEKEDADDFKESSDEPRTIKENNSLEFDLNLPSNDMAESTSHFKNYNFDMADEDKPTSKKEAEKQNNNNNDEISYNFTI